MTLVWWRLVLFNNSLVEMGIKELLQKRNNNYFGFEVLDHHYNKNPYIKSTNSLAEIGAIEQ